VKAAMLSLLVLLAPVLAFAEAENLGTLSISDVLLRPQFTAAPKDVAARGFSIGESSIGVKWDYEKIFSGHVRIGSQDLAAPPAHYNATFDPNNLQMVEAYAEFNHPYGRFRLGKQPIDFGLEGAKSEGDLIFPRSLMFERRIVGLRDVGFGYLVDYNNFYTEFVIHNGEGGNAVDNDYWYTARWGYKLDRFEIGASGQTGHTEPAATTGSLDTLAAVQVDKSEHWRMGGLFVSWRPKRITVEAEGYLGQLEQDDAAAKFATGHSDFGYEFSETFSAHLRYDYLDPNLTVDDDTTHRAAVAVVFTNKSRNSRVIVMAAHDFNEGHQGDDQYRLIWSLSPTQLPSSF
jgi:hypothetical protein